MKHGNRSTVLSVAAVGVLRGIWRAVLGGAAMYGAGLYGCSCAELLELDAADASDAEASHADRDAGEVAMPVSLDTGSSRVALAGRGRSMKFQ
jgi:hypothetical protein